MHRSRLQILPHKSVTAGLLLALLPLSLAYGQTAAPASPAEKPADTFSLPVLQVTSEGDVGYTAASAQAGGRINTPLKDTPAAVSILTREFLDDIGATSFSGAAEWAPNSIPAGNTVDGAGGEHNVNVRGLGSSFPSRNYFRWYISSDSFSTERLEFARGANSIIFGDANPGGVNTTWSKQALFRDAYSVQLRVDDWGGYRASTDLNQTVGDHLAIRLNLLWDRLGGWRDGDDPERDGIHLATTYRFNQNKTQLRAEYEQGRYSRYAFSQFFTDQVSNWDGTTSYSGTGTPSTAGTGIARINATATADYLVYDPAIGSVVNWKGFYQTTGTGLSMLPDTRNIAKFPVLPSPEFSLQPPDAYIEATYHTWTFYLEHQFNPDLIAQVAFNHQDQLRKGNSRAYTPQRIDVNKTLPGGGVNPNYGRRFTDAVPDFIERPNDLSDVRASLAYHHDWKWLVESLNVMSGYRQDAYAPKDYRLGRVDNPTIPAVNNASNTLTYRQYWDNPLNPATLQELVSNGMNFQTLWVNGSWEKQMIQYNQISTTSQFLDRRLTVLGGYRYDFFERDNQRNVGSTPQGVPVLGGSGGPGTYDNYSKGIGTFSAGLVYFPVEWAGAYFNYSEGFNAPGNGEAKIDGSPIQPSATSGFDVGIKAEFFGGKVAGSIGYYDSQQTDRPRAGDNLADINEIWTSLGKPENTITGYRDTESWKGHGVEIDLTANITRNWRTMFNLAFPETEQVEIGAGLTGYYNENLAEWTAGANNPNNPNAALIRQDITDIETTLQGYTQGRVLNNTIDYTANIYSTYEFHEGPLNGFGFGAGANFRGKQLIGNANGQPFNYLYTPAYYLVAAHVSYEHKLFGKMARFQVNVSNLLDEDDVVFKNYQYSAALGSLPNSFRYQDPRRISFTATFNF